MHRISIGYISIYTNIAPPNVDTREYRYSIATPTLRPLNKFYHGRYVQELYEIVGMLAAR